MLRATGLRRGTETAYGATTVPGVGYGGTGPGQSGQSEAGGRGRVCLRVRRGCVGTAPLCTLSFYNFIMRRRTGLGRRRVVWYEGVWALCRATVQSGVVWGADGRLTCNQACERRVRPDDTLVADRSVTSHAGTGHVSRAGTEAPSRANAVCLHVAMGGCWYA